MKKIYSLTFAALTAVALLKAQSPCSTGRYATDTFTNVTTTSGVVYGSNVKANGSTQSLTMDIYQPTGDVATARPLIIWAHGGSFLFGSSTDVDVVTLSQRFAKKGYVCVSINYRLGNPTFDSVGLVKAVLRAVQDMKASVRYFYKDKQTVNTYKIDTNNVFIAGSSAGAVTSLHYAYLNKQCEVNQYLDNTTFNALGGIDGTSGNPGYSTKVKGVVNLCGALATYGWLEAGDLPFCSMHGTADGTVNYARASALGLLVIDGSRYLKQQATVVGVANSLYTWYGAPHVPYAGTSASQVAYMDTTVSFVRDYLISRMGCTDAPLLQPNTPSGAVSLYSFTVCNNSAGVKELNNNIVQTLYPNPSSDKVTLAFVNATAEHTIVLMDVTGKIIRTEKTSSSEFTFEKSSIQAGIYFLKVIASNGQSSVHKIVFN